MAITTIKLAKSTKERIDKLKEYKRETYDEILQKMLSILTVLSVNPERARVRLASIERKKRRSQNPLKYLKQRMKQKIFQNNLNSESSEQKNSDSQNKQKKTESLYY